MANLLRFEVLSYVPDKRFEVSVTEKSAIFQRDFEKNMLRKIISIGLVMASIVTSSLGMAQQGIHGEYSVRFGFLPLGDVVMSSTCSDNICHYDTKVKGSFMMIGADINERGKYRLNEKQILPMSSTYVEKIGSKYREYTYDFQTMEIDNGDTREKVDLPEGIYPFIPLINQVALDLGNGGPRKSYQYLSKKKVRQADVIGYDQKAEKGGTLHQVTAKRKDKILEFVFLQSSTDVRLERLKYGSFKMVRKG